jgi:hypothetical protein
MGPSDRDATGLGPRPGGDDQGRHDDTIAKQTAVLPGTKDTSLSPS